MFLPSHRKGLDYKVKSIFNLDKRIKDMIVTLNLILFNDIRKLIWRRNERLESK